MSTPIKHDDIRKGDRVRMVHETKLDRALSRAEAKWVTE